MVSLKSTKTVRQSDVHLRRFATAMPYNALEIVVPLNFIKIRHFNKHKAWGRNTSPINTNIQWIRLLSANT